ncbi:MAG: acyl-CoA mutase large subunit family protein [Bacteroidales bacterium]|nr:acyl-CoA mutase large subunit family protein [Bacteroidales bacterium]MCB8998566.1 acyl-CoA mutase large subunit family protein [Bacteroidales bacterium]MCB9012566.1 acyl-CoA mutase large subunit family protein [Bacteroidales bacterium]
MSDQNNTSALFREFSAVDPVTWKEKLVQDLKGIPYEKLVWKSHEGIEIKPFYTPEDLRSITYLESVPGQFPFLRGTRSAAPDWEIRQDILVEDFGKANAEALNALNRGATSLAFIFGDDLKITQGDFSLLLRDIIFECIDINFISHKHSSEILSFLTAEAKGRNIDISRIFGSLGNDPFGYLSEKGHFNHSEKDDFKTTASLISQNLANSPAFKTLSVNAGIFHNSGGSIVQEVAYCLAMISDYLDVLSGAGLKPADVARSMRLNFSVGSNYFMEIAKLRAVRFLFARLIKSWEVEDEEAMKAFIHCSTSAWNQTIYDPYVNMLRSTTESMSAVLGGCNSLTVNPFDKPFRRSTKFSNRIARNTQIILKEEAWLDKVTDPAAGSYFIESLTDSIITEAWKLFLEIEEKGGYLACFKSGHIQEEIRKSAIIKMQNIATRKEVLLGTNQFPNSGESKPEDLEMDVAFPENSDKDVIAPPLKAFRAGEAFEKLRLRLEEKPPKVFLLSIGNPVWSKARAGFASGFFACGGFEIMENNSFDSIESGIKSALESKAAIVVLCSSDDEYSQLAPEAMMALQNKAILVIAGNPKDSIEDLKSKGIMHFIHLKSNVLEELEKFGKMCNEL